MNGPEYSRRVHLLQYGLSPEEYDNILREQNGVCAICAEPPRDRRLCVDHDHETDEVRGLLCWRCNSALGLFRDNVRLLAGAIVYLDQSRS